MNSKVIKPDQTSYLTTCVCGILYRKGAGLAEESAHSTCSLPKPEPASAKSGPYAQGAEVGSNGRGLVYAPYIPEGFDAQTELTSLLVDEITLEADRRALEYLNVISPMLRALNREPGKQMR